MRVAKGRGRVPPLTEWPLLALFVVHRVINALLVQTYFDPDEYWQGPEIAHSIVFGYGHRTWEWGEDAMIRGFLHPMILSLPYYVLSFTGMDTPALVGVAVHIFQGVLAAFMDYFTLKLCYRFLPTYRHGSHHSLTLPMITALCCSWFMAYCTTRTYSNTMEAVLTVLALYYWPFSAHVNHGTGKTILTNRQWSLLIAAVSVIVRPTALIVWLWLGPLYLLSLFFNRCRNWISFVLEVLVIGILVLLAACAVDRIGYGSWTLVPWNFFLVNVLNDVGSFYGQHPLNWYIFQAWPTLLASFIPFVGIGIFVAVYQRRATLVDVVGGSGGRCACKKCNSTEGNSPHAIHLLLVILWTTAVYSKLVHKEFRFIFPMLPIALIFCSVGLHFVWNWAARHASYRTFLRFVVVALVVANIPVAIYFSGYHQAAPISVMRYIRNDPSVKSVHFFTPCHGTPLYSAIHKNIPTKFLDCSPPIQELYQDKALVPSHVVLYEQAHEKARSAFRDLGFKECARFYHTLTPLDEKQEGYMLVLCNQDLMMTIH